jgi:hypothetical protein
MNYGAIYNSLMARAKHRTRPDEYCEKHHILPKALGGVNAPDNLVYLTAREHFFAHRLLWRIHRNRQMARAFTLLARTVGTTTSKDYAEAKAAYAAEMLGSKNVSKRAHVKQKISANHARYFAGKKRPDHAKLMREKGLIAGHKNPMFGQGHRQAGAKNHMAKKVVGLHAQHGAACWDTATEAAQAIGVSVQAVAQAVKRNARSRGWKLEYAV